MNIYQSALGKYEQRGVVADGDCILGQSFGTETGAESVNAELAWFILKHANNRPIIVDRMLADAFPDPEHTPFAHIVEGPASSATGKGVGSWGILVSAKEYMEQENLKRPVMVAQSHHIGRVALQGDKLGIDSIVPPNLPFRFETNEKHQPWVIDQSLWFIREVIGSHILRARGQL